MQHHTKSDKVDVMVGNGATTNSEEIIVLLSILAKSIMLHCRLLSTSFYYVSCDVRSICVVGNLHHVSTQQSISQLPACRNRKLQVGIGNMDIKLFKSVSNWAYIA